LSNFAGVVCPKTKSKDFCSAGRSKRPPAARQGPASGKLSRISPGEAEREKPSETEGFSSDETRESGTILGQALKLLRKCFFP
jgi:hypothetical protein